MGDSGKKRFQATSAAGSLASLRSKFPALPMSTSGNESDDEEDDFIDDELLGEDFAPVFEGSLSLKDFEEGDWVDCYGILQREMFSLYTTDHEGSTELELFDSADVRKIADVIYHEEQLTVVQYEHDGHPFIIRGGNLQALHDKIQEAMRVFGEKGETKCGWLLKKPSYMEGHLDTSGGNHNLGKPRFVRLTPKSLRYYIDDELDSMEVGSINLLAMDSVICEDEEDSGNCVFEVHSGQRIVVFEATSREETDEWVQKLNEVHGSALQESDELKEEKYNANTDDRILLFDHEGPEAFTLRIDSDLSHAYPTQAMAIVMNEEAKAHAEEGGEDVPDLPWWPATVEDHIYCADGCVEYLADFVSRIQKNEFQEARYEVLSRCVLRVNTYFSTRMLPFLSDPNSDELVAATANDIYSLILWITKYQKILRFIYCPVDSALDGSSSPNKANTLTHCSIFEEMPALCQRYLDGNAENNIEGTASHLIGVCLKMWSNVLKAPADAIDRHKDGTFFTHTPSDVWRSLRQHITLATKAESPVLHVMVADKISVTMIHLIDSITEWLTFNYHDTVEGVDKVSGTLEGETSENAGKEEDASAAGRGSNDPTSTTGADAGRSLKEVQLEFLCALANDNALHIEEVYDITDNFASDDIRESIETAFDPVTTRIVACGNLCLKRLANVVLADVEEIMEEVMTESWLNHDGDDDNDGNEGDDSGGQMASIIATLEDYLADILTYLNNFWSKKFIAVLFEAMAVRYTRAILFRKMKAGVTSAFKNLTGSMPKGGVTPQRSLDGVNVHEHDHENASAINLESEFDDEDDDEDVVKADGDDEMPDEGGSRMSVNIAHLSRRMSVGMSSLKTGLTSMLSPTNTEASGSSAPNTKQDTNNGKSFFGNIMSTKKAATLTLDNEIIGRIAQDQSAMNSFFTKHGGQELASEVLVLVSEVITLCSLPAEQLTTHAVSLIADHPVAAISVREAALACMRLRDDLSSEEKEYALQKMELILMGAEAAARKNEIEGIDEGRLGLLYVELVENAINAGALAPHPDAKKSGNSLANSLAQRQKEKAGVNMNSMHDSKRKLKSETVRKREALEEETEGLLTKVVEALAHQEEARKEYMEAEDRELARAQEMLKSHANIVHFKGFLERKPPSALTWTKNYFLLATKKNEEAVDHTDIEAMATYKVYKYNFGWSEHRNTQVRHSFDVENIYSIFLLEIPMECQLVFVEEDHVLMLREHLDDYLENLLQQGGYDMDNHWFDEEIGDDERVYPVRINGFAKNPDVKGLTGSAATSPKSITMRESVTGRAATMSGNEPCLTFCLSMIDGAKHLLRTRRLGKAVHWINSIANAGSFSYEHENKEWNRQARMMLKEKDKMRGVELLEQQQQLKARMDEHNRIKEQLARQQEAIEQRMQQEQQELRRQLEEESAKKNNPRERKKSMSADRARRDSVRNNNASTSTVDISTTNDTQQARYNMGEDLESSSLKNPIIASSTTSVESTGSSRRGTHNPIHMQTDVGKAVSLMNDLDNNGNYKDAEDAIPVKAVVIDANHTDSSMMVNIDDAEVPHRRDSDHIPSSGHTQTLPISSIANLPTSNANGGNEVHGMEDIRLSSLSEKAKARGQDTYVRRLTAPMNGSGLTPFEEWEQQKKQPGCADKCMEGGCIVS